MKREDLLAVIDGFFGAMNQHDVEKMARYCSDDVIADEVAEAAPFVGIEAFKKSYSDVFQGYPDCIAEVKGTYVDGDVVICQVRWWANNLGVFRGAEPTGKKVDIRIAYFFHLKGGKIHQITEYYDVATLLVQQGQLEL